MPGFPAAVAPIAPPEAFQPAIRAWNLLGGLEWAGLDAVAEILGITDIEALVVQLVAIRDWQHDHPPETR